MMNFHKKRLNIKVFLWLAILTISTVGCNIQQRIAPDEMPFASLPAANKQPMAYLIHPGDQLDIRFFYNPELNVALPVRPDGKVSLLMIGEITAAGLQPSELEAQLKVKYKNQLREPMVTVMVKSFAGQQVFVDGEVEHPGPIEITSDLTAWEAIIKAGGFKDSASRDSVIVMRINGNNQITPYRLDLKSDSLNQPQVVMQLQGHDVIYVPKTWIAEADKFSEQYIEKLLLFKGWYINLSPISPVLK